MNFIYKRAGSTLVLALALGWAAYAQPRSPNRDVATALGEMDRGDYRQAAQRLETVIRLEPRSDAEVYIMLATCQWNLKQTSQAIAVCERGLALYPDSPRLQRFYVAVLRTADTRERQAKLEQSLLQKPDSAVYLKGLAELLLEENRDGFEIKPLVTKAAKALPRDPEAHYLYGQWACLNDQSELSVRELNKALELTPASNDRARMQIHTYLGISYERLQRPAEAEAAYRKAIAFNQRLGFLRDPGVLIQYAKFLQGEGRLAEAQKVVEEALQWAPSFGVARLERAKILIEQERTEEALAEGELALKYAGDDVKQKRAAHALLARASRLLGRTQEARLHEKWIEAH